MLKKASFTCVILLPFSFYLGYYTGSLLLLTNTDKNLLPSPQSRGADAETRTSRLFRVTAYCPCKQCCGKWSKHKTTASGKPVTYNNGRFVAAPRDIPFNTLITIPGYGTVPVIDRGQAITGKRLDVFFPTHQEALDWGIQELQCTIY